MEGVGMSGGSCDAEGSAAHLLLDRRERNYQALACMIPSVRRGWNAWREALLICMAMIDGDDSSRTPPRSNLSQMCNIDLIASKLPRISIYRTMVMTHLA